MQNYITLQTTPEEIENMLRDVTALVEQRMLRRWDHYDDKQKDLYKKARARLHWLRDNSELFAADAVLELQHQAREDRRLNMVSGFS